MIFYSKKVVLDVLSLNNFIITKPIKTKQNVKHIIRQREIVGRDAGLQVNENLVPRYFIYILAFCIPVVYIQ